MATGEGEAGDVNEPDAGRREPVAEHPDPPEEMPQRVGPLERLRFALDEAVQAFERRCGRFVGRFGLPQPLRAIRGVPAFHRLFILLLRLLPGPIEDFAESLLRFLRQVDDSRLHPERRQRLRQFADDLGRRRQQLVDCLLDALGRFAVGVGAQHFLGVAAEQPPQQERRLVALRSVPIVKHEANEGQGLLAAWHQQRQRLLAHRLGGADAEPHQQVGDRRAVEFHPFHNA